MFNQLFIYLTTLNGVNAYFIVFTVLFACGIGLPLPEDIPLIAAGYLIWRGDMNMFSALGITLLAILLGDSMIYYIGRRLALSVLDPASLKKPFFKAKKIEKAQALFERYGDKLVFFARFVAGFRAAVFFSAGALKMRFGRFITFDSLAAIVSVPLWLLLGYCLGVYFGDEIDTILTQIKHYKHWFLIGLLIVIALVVISFAIKYYRVSRHSRS